MIKKYLHLLLLILVLLIIGGWIIPFQSIGSPISAAELSQNTNANDVHLPLVVKPLQNAPLALTETPTAAATSPPISTPTVTPTSVPTGPARTRFNFEVAGHVARNGVCTMNRYQSDPMLTWNSIAGETDSASHPDAGPGGWIPVHIPFVSIYVEVFCDDGSGFVRMDLYNAISHPTTGQPVGWLTREQDHAIEIGWPDGGPAPTPTPAP